MSQEDNSEKNWQNLPFSNPKPDLHNIMHIPSLVKINYYLLSFLKIKNTDMLQADTL